MLHELSIKNMALIDKAYVQFKQGLNVLTGETGAGKTVIIGAVNLLLGGRADSSLIRHGSDKAEVQGRFSLVPAVHDDELLCDVLDDSDELIIRRVISTDGKNKCYINDRMVTVSTLANLGRRLIDLHGQHEHQSLFKTASHLEFLDKYGGDALLALRAEFAGLYSSLKKAKDELARLKGAERELFAKRDLLKFQVSEIDTARLVEGEDDELMRERELLRNAEKLYESAAQAASVLTETVDCVPAVDLLAQAIGGLKGAGGIDAELDEVAERLQAAMIEVEDCAASLRDYGSKLDFPPGRLQEVEDRIALLTLLKKKYGATIEEIVQYREKAAEELGLCDTSGERIEALEGKIDALEAGLVTTAERLSAARRSAAERFSAEAMRELADLNMASARFTVLLTREPDKEGLPLDGEKIKMYPHGIDRVEFMVSANKGEQVKPLVKIASGGEISRIMLALKIILADADEVPTLIFDEVDVGIGGTTAMAVGRKMAVLSKKHQVLAVTHLPQIASFADSHFSVVKKELDERTVTEIEELLHEDRVGEMARLLSGNIESDVSLQHAEALLIEAQNDKRRVAHERIDNI